MQKLKHETLSFDGFTLDLTRGSLLHRSEEIKLRPKSFEVLKYLIENNGRLVSKDELMQAMWPDTAVTDDSLVQCLIEIRRALGDETHRYVKTVPRRGYIFESEVTKRDLEPDREVVYTEDVEGVRITIEEEETERGDTEPITLSGEGALRPNKPLALTGRRRPSRAVVLISVCTVIVLAASALLFSRLRRAPSASQPAPIRSVAVLPFKNLSGDAAEEYFSDGMTESLITALSKVDGLKVISRGSVFRFKEKEVEPQDVGRQLGVAAVLEGSVRKSGNVVRVTARLVSAEDGRVLWVHDTNEVSLSDIFAMQDRIARDLATGLRLKLGGDRDVRLAKAGTTNVEAYQHYLRGQYHLNRWRREDVEKSIGYFNRAIDLYPDYSLAYAGLANAYFALQPLGPQRSRDVMPKAKAAALRALELDEQLAEAHAALGFVLYSYEWDWAGAEKEFKRAIELNENSAMAHDQYSWYLTDMGRFDEAFAENKRALELDPLSVPIHRDSAFIFYYARQYDRAIEQCEKIRELDPHFWQAYSWLAVSYEAKGLYEEAIEAESKAGEVAGISPERLAAGKQAYASGGWKGYWRKRLEMAKDQEKQKYVEPYSIAVMYVRLGENEEALKYLEKAYEARSAAWMTTIRNDTALDPLRSDPRFQDLLRRVGLPQ